jgi:hypothetical protein
MPGFADVKNGESIKTSSEYIISNYRMNNELERTWKEMVIA